MAKNVVFACHAACGGAPGLSAKRKAFEKRKGSRNPAQTLYAGMDMGGRKNGSGQRETKLSACGGGGGYGEESKGEGKAQSEATYTEKMVWKQLCSAQTPHPELCAPASAMAGSTVGG
jgi:hypothetical protein